MNIFIRRSHLTKARHGERQCFKRKNRMFEIIEKSQQKLVIFSLLCSILEIGAWLAQVRNSSSETKKNLRNA